jgi:hypothetical protein
MIHFVESFANSFDDIEKSVVTGFPVNNRLSIRGKRLQFGKNRCLPVTRTQDHRDNTGFALLVLFHGVAKLDIMAVI